MDQEEAYLSTLENTEEVLKIYKDYLLNKANIGAVKVEFRNGPQFADYDREVFVNECFNHYVEVKIRTTPMFAFPKTKVPLRKHTFAEHSIASSGKTSYFLCGFSDGMVGLLDLGEEPTSVEIMTARYDRGVERDLYALYNINRFIILSS